MSMLVLHPNTRIWSAGALIRTVGVVAGGVFVEDGIGVLLVLAEVGGIGVTDVFVTPIITGVGLEITGVLVGRTKGVGGLLGSGCTTQPSQDVMVSKIRNNVINLFISSFSSCSLYPA
jgi:hypothetical protein